MRRCKATCYNPTLAPWGGKEGGACVCRYRYLAVVSSAETADVNTYCSTTPGRQLRACAKPRKRRIGLFNLLLYQQNLLCFI